MDASLSRRFAVVLLALLIPVLMVTASIRHGLFSNARHLIQALHVGRLAEKSLSLVLTQDDVTKELFLDPRAVDLAARKIAAYDENLAILAELRRLADSGEVTRIIDEMAALDAQLRPLDTEILETLLAGDAESARALYFGTYWALRSEYEEQSVALSRLSERLARSAEADMLERNRRTVLEVVGALLLGIATVALLIVRLSGRLGQRTAAVLEVLEGVAEGDLRGEPEDASRDELGRIARALRGAIAGMRRTVAHVSESLDRVGDGTRQIHGLAGDVGQAAAGQLEGIDWVVRAMANVTSDAEGLAESADVLAGAAGRSASAVEELRDGSEELRVSGETLGQVVDGVSGAVARVLASLDEVTRFTDELARAAISTKKGSYGLALSFHTIDENAAETERRSSEVVDVVERGRRDVERTIAGMTAIREATDEADEAIALLMRRAAEIDQIVDVITGVGDETSLLALNAAILAAQAGDRGKPFGVVAEQIKKLAASVLTHTREVTNRIAAVQEQARRVAEAIGRGSERVRAGVEVSREAGENYAAIQAAAHESGRRMQEVVDAVRNESTSVEQMVALASTLDSVAVEIRRALGDQRREAGVLRDSAGHTTEIANQLRLRADTQSRDTRSLADVAEKVRESSEQIRAAVCDQRESCAQVAKTLQRVAEGGHRNEASARSVRDRLAALEREAEELRDRIAWFKS